ncbi:MAG: succinate dehydrogenase assembly factor 2 [Alphaproteobacteria bacterium]|nr:succinate dehydrogenase assembly factor 2 [Alphaproteobacteria bacterium]
MSQITPEDNISTKRKRLIFRSWHRGTREIDVLLGKFADMHIPKFDAKQLADYDRFLINSDPDIFNWITGIEPVPPSEDNNVVALLINFFKCGKEDSPPTSGESGKRKISQ